MSEILIAIVVTAAVVGLVGWFVARLAWGEPLSKARAAAATAYGELTALRDSEIALRLRVAESGRDLAGAQDRLIKLEADLATLGETQQALARLEATQAERDQAHVRQLQTLNEEFQKLANAALEKAQTQFLTRADARFLEQQEKSEGGLKALLQPVAETLSRYEGELKKVEKARDEAYGGLKEQLVAVATGQRQVSEEAAKLVSALRSSSKTSGSWGEQQLLNTLEMAGLRADIDFTLQTHAGTESGSRRPDAIINLPGGRQLIVDSKCSLKDYLEGVEAGSEAERLAALKRHAGAIRQHARGLSEKAYWNEFGASADFVVMFIPGENFLSAALEHDLPLLGWAFDQRILLAGPINLLAIARMVAMVWRQEKLADEAREIGKLGADLHAAIATMAEHLGGVGRNLAQAVGSYNSFVGSLEANVLPKARRFTDMGIEKGKKAVPNLGALDTAVRPVAARELLPLPPGMAGDTEEAAE